MTEFGDGFMLGVFVVLFVWYLWTETRKIRCPECGNDCVSHVGEDFVNGVWINVYECDCCKKKFV